MVRARSQAASKASGLCGLASRMMPRQERKPGSGWLRSRRMTSISVAVLGPIFAAPVFVGPGLQPLGRPFGMTPVAGRHVIRDGRVLAIARGSDVGGDALTLVEYLDRPCGKPDPDFLAQ